MSYRMLQMGLRSTTLILMMIALFYNSECYDLALTYHFIMSSVYGAYIVITIGLLIDAALHFHTDIFIEASLLSLAIILNIVCCVLAFIEFHKGPIRKGYSTSTIAINKAFVSMFGAVIYMIDLIFSLNYYES